MINNKNVIEIGIIGYGNFGKFLTQILPDSTKVYIYDKTASHKDESFVSLEKAASCEIIILAVPLMAYDDILPKIAKQLRPTQLIIDVCSVKLMPEKIIAKHIPEHKSLLMTHPLFGPQTYRKKPSNNKLIVTSPLVGKNAQAVIGYCKEKLNIEIKFMTAEEHDKLMSNIHAVTFFIARGLANLNLPKKEFVTPSYEQILNLVAFNESHTDELFQTIQNGNPYANEARKKVIESFTELDSDLNTKQINSSR